MGKSNLIIWDRKEIQTDCFEIKNKGGETPALDASWEQLAISGFLCELMPNL